MSATRRGLLGGAAVLAVASPAISADHPDAELIRLCAEHIVNMDTYNRDGGMLPLGEPDVLWEAYKRTRDAISKAKPRTLAGMLAKARAAKAEARMQDGTEDPADSPAERWAWQLVNDLLAGRAEG